MTKLRNAKNPHSLRESLTQLQNHVRLVQGSYNRVVCEHADVVDLGRGG